MESKHFIIGFNYPQTEVKYGRIYLKAAKHVSLAPLNDKENDTIFIANCYKMIEQSREYEGKIALNRDKWCFEMGLEEQRPFENHAKMLDFLDNWYENNILNK